MKTCSKCGIEKPLTVEYFKKRKKGSLDGFNGVCKVCAREYMLVYYEKNKPKLLNQRKEYYQENKEQISKNAKIYYQENIKQWQKYNKEYFKANKEHLTTKSKQYYEENREDILEQKKQYQQTHKEQIAKYKKEHYKELITNNTEYNKDRYMKHRKYHFKQNKKYYKANKEQIKAQVAQYQKDNPHISRQANQKRKARENGVLSTLTIEEWDKVKLSFNNSCAYCGMSEENHLKEFSQRLHQEHFIALINGGEYTHNNIVPACRSCNSSKSNKNFFKWYPKQENYSVEREKKILEYLS